MWLYLLDTALWVAVKVVVWVALVLSIAASDWPTVVLSGVAVVVLLQLRRLDDIEHR